MATYHHQLEMEVVRLKTLANALRKERDELLRMNQQYVEEIRLLGLYKMNQPKPTS